MRPIIGIIGTASADKSEYETSVKVGKEIAKRNCVLICGGMEGVMEGACKGASSENGLTIGILPGSNKSDSNKYVDIPIVTGLSQARNIIVVRSSDVIIAIGGEFGTLSEIAFALKFNIPVVGIKTWDVSEKIYKINDPVEAVDKALRLANNSNGDIWMRPQKT